MPTLDTASSPQDNFGVGGCCHPSSPACAGEALTQRIGSSMVEQRPFKALVEGSSPSLSTNFFNLAQIRSERCWQTAECSVARKECELSRGTSVPVGQRFFVSRGAPGQVKLYYYAPLQKLFKFLVDCTIGCGIVSTLTHP